MAKSKVDLQGLKKVVPSKLASKRVVDPDAVVEAILKIRTPNYVPEGVQVRARIDDTMFTATFVAARLSEIENDPNVVSVALSRPLRWID